MPPTARFKFWLQTRRLTWALLAAWLMITIAVPWFARQLDGVRGFGFSAGYWLAAEGALMLYLVIIIVYAWRMDALEGRLLDEPQDSENTEPEMTVDGTVRPR